MKECLKREKDPKECLKTGTDLKEFLKRITDLEECLKRESDLKEYLLKCFCVTEGKRIQLSEKQRTDVQTFVCSHAVLVT